MYLTKQKKQAIRDAVSNVIFKHTQELLGEHFNAPPEFWTVEERRVFDMLSEIEYSITDKIDELLREQKSLLEHSQVSDIVGKSQS